MRYETRKASVVSGLRLVADRLRQSSRSMKFIATATGMYISVSSETIYSAKPKTMCDGEAEIIYKLQFIKE